MTPTMMASSTERMQTAAIIPGDIETAIAIGRYLLHLKNSIHIQH